MTFPPLTEYFVECWDWLKNVNDTEKIYIEMLEMKLLLMSEPG